MPVEKAICWPSGDQAGRLASGVVVGSLYALCAVGWGLIYGTTLHFHVAHGAVFSLAAYFAYRHPEWSPEEIRRQVALRLLGDAGGAAPISR